MNTLEPGHYAEAVHFGRHVGSSVVEEYAPSQAWPCRNTSLTTSWSSGEEKIQLGNYSRDIGLSSCADTRTSGLANGGEAETVASNEHGLLITPSCKVRASYICGGRLKCHLKVG